MGQLKQDRRTDDAYYTPPELAEAICSKLKQAMQINIIVEPHAGSGSFVRAAEERWPHTDVFAADINGKPEKGIVQNDWLDDSTEFNKGVELAANEAGNRILILGNPPYNDAQAHVEAALKRLGHYPAAASFSPRQHYVAFLLRSSFLASKERVSNLYRTAPPRFVWHVAPRPSFTGDGKTDGAEYAVIVWQAGYRGHYQGDWLLWDKKAIDTKRVKP